MRIIRYIIGVAAVAVLVTLGGDSFFNTAPLNSVVGKARIIDGDTLSVSGKRIRLHGIDAPESKQSCNDANGQTWDCGAYATIALERFIGRAVVRCHAKDVDQYGRMVPQAFFELCSSATLPPQCAVPEKFYAPVKDESIGVEI